MLPTHLLTNTKNIIATDAVWRAGRYIENITYCFVVDFLSGGTDWCVFA